MACLEKLIKYDQAVLAPAGELELLDNGSRLRLKPLEGLVYLAHFEKPSPGSEIYGATLDELNRIAILGTKSGHQLTAEQKKFGNSALRDLALNAAVSVAVIPDRIGQSPELTVDFWYRATVAHTMGKTRALVERWYPHWCWRTYHLNREIGLDLSLTPSTYFSLQTSGLNLTTDWYHLRFTMMDGDGAGQPGYAKIFANGSEAAACEFEGPVEKYGEGFDKSCLKILNYLDYASSIACYFDELRIFDRYLPDNFTPPSEATKPFSSSVPKARISLDAGAANALWVMSELAFLIETDFDNEGIKLRTHADNDNSPEFSGDPMSLASARQLGNLSGRYLHLEFSFLSDGDTQRTLYAGKVGLKSQQVISARRAPEIIRTF